jgi:hypothetical protein
VFKKDSEHTLNIIPQIINPKHREEDELLRKRLQTARLTSIIDDELVTEKGEIHILTEGD